MYDVTPNFIRGRQRRRLQGSIAEPKLLRPAATSHPTGT